MNANSQRLLGALISVSLFGGCMGTSVDFDSAPTDPSAAGAGGTDDTDGPASDAGGDGNEGPALPGSVEWIAFDTDEGGLDRDLYAVRLDTGERRPLVTSEANEVHPAFSPDGKHLTFVSDSESNIPQVFLMDLESSEVTRLTDGPQGAQRPAFSPDGERIGFRRERSIYTIALDGSDEQLLPNSETTSIISGEPGDLGGPAFSSVDGWIVLDAFNEVRATSFAGDATHVIVPPNTARQSHPTVSPSGFTVVLEVTCGDGYISIWSVPFSGIDGLTCQVGRKLSPTDSTSHTHPAFGPGDRLVWDRGNGEGDLVLWDAGSLTEVTSGVADDRNPTWVPAGTELP